MNKRQVDPLVQLEEKIDTLSDYEKDFVLYILLAKFIDDCEKEIYTNKYVKWPGYEAVEREPRTRSEYATLIMLDRHMKTAKEMRNVLSYRLF